VSYVTLASPSGDSVWNSSLQSPKNKYTIKESLCNLKMARFFRTSYDIQDVPLHEVRNVISGSFVSQLLTGFGASLFTACYPITLTIGTFTIALGQTRFGLGLILLGVIAYVALVSLSYRSWRRRRIPSTRGPTQTTRTDGAGERRSIYA
jgi:hypothetical protein